MKKLIIAVIAFTGFGVISFSQAVPAQKADASKMHVVKIKTTKKVGTKTVAITNASRAKTKTVVITKPSVVIKTNTTVPLKKDGTPDKRFKASTITVAGPQKKDGTPDMRYNVNKKH